AMCTSSNDIEEMMPDEVDTPNDGVRFSFCFQVPVPPIFAIVPTSSGHKWVRNTVRGFRLKGDGEEPKPAKGVASGMTIVPSDSTNQSGGIAAVPGGCFTAACYYTTQHMIAAVVGSAPARVVFGVNDALNEFADSAWMTVRHPVATV